ncbi:MAG: hypothetical protein QME63_07740 [Actinomycetota bacterium]|nr:hypothetical protein [Actinomycetota bacterium]
MSYLDILKSDINPLTKRIIFAGMLTMALEKEGFSPVVTNNYAVELYTQGNYEAETIDIVAPVELINKVLPSWDFARDGDFWVNQDLGIKVKSHAEDLDEKEMQRVAEINFNGATIYLLGVDDLIVNKLIDFASTDDRQDYIWAQEIMELFINEIDLDYLRDRAAEKGVYEPLQSIINEILPSEFYK